VWEKSGESVQGEGGRKAISHGSFRGGRIGRQKRKRGESRARGAKSGERWEGKGCGEEKDWGLGGRGVRKKVRAEKEGGHRVGVETRWEWWSTGGREGGDRKGKRPRGREKRGGKGQAGVDSYKG